MIWVTRMRGLALPRRSERSTAFEDLDAFSKHLAFRSASRHVLDELVVIAQGTLAVLFAKTDVGEVVERADPIGGLAAAVKGGEIPLRRVELFQFQIGDGTVEQRGFVAGLDP